MPTPATTSATTTPGTDDAGGLKAVRQVSWRSVLVNLPDDAPALGAGELVDVELAVEVVGLVLQAPGQLTGPGEADRLLPQIHAGRDRMGRAGAFGADPRDGQASLGPGLSAAQLDDLRVDQVTHPAAHVVGERGQAGADLVGGQPGAARLLHGLQQVIDEPDHGIVEADHRVAGRA